MKKEKSENLEDTLQRLDKLSRELSQLQVVANIKTATRLSHEITQLQVVTNIENARRKKSALAALCAGKSREMAVKTGYSDQHLRAVKCGEEPMTDRLARRIIDAK